MDTEDVRQEFVDKPCSMVRSDQYESRNSQVEYYYKLRHMPTDGAIVKKRPGKGGKEFDYVNRDIVMRWLDENFPGWSWEFDPNSFMFHGNLEEHWGFWNGVGKLTVADKFGNTRAIQTAGSIEVKFSYDQTTKKRYEVPTFYYKSVDTDALKRAVATLGGFSDVYSDMEVEVIDIHEDDIIWFIEVAYPIIKEKFSNVQGAKAMKGLFNKSVTRKDICDTFGV